MLVFKKNIYLDPLRLKKSSGIKEFRDEEDPSPLPFNFIYKALSNAQNLFQEIKDTENRELSDQLDILFPHASRLGKTEILSDLSHRLFTGLTHNQIWFTMNCYHQCFLYDCLLDVVEDYSYNDEAARRELFPEMKGQPLDFNRFLLEYFFNTTFLIAPERFNPMSPEERKQLLRSPDFGQDFPQLKRFSDPEDSTLAKVINSVPPDPEEMVLKPLEQNPYLLL
ncbi:MAG: hypothetical protein V3R14_04330 [Nitrospinaceae bacterium]